MTFQRTSTTFSSAETGCPSLLGSPMTNVSSNSLASPIPVSNSTLKMKERISARVLPKINGESSTSTHLKAIHHSILQTFIQKQPYQAFTTSSIKGGAILKVTVSVFAELLFTCRSVTLKPPLLTEVLVGATTDVCTSLHSLPLMRLSVLSQIMVYTMLTVKQATS